MNEREKRLYTQAYYVKRIMPNNKVVLSMKALGYLIVRQMNERLFTHKYY